MLIAKSGGGFIKKRKKAFTLIELLAIIVILAIIAVITVPIILNIIENSRKGAATDSAYGYKDSVNKWYVSELSNTNNQNFNLSSSYTVEDGKIIDDSVQNDTGTLIPFSGDKPSSGELHYSNNVFKGGCLVFGDYAVTFETDGTTSTVKGDCSEYVFPSELTYIQYYGYDSDFNYFDEPYLPSNALVWGQTTGEFAFSCTHENYDMSKEPFCINSGSYDCGTASVDSNNKIVCSQEGYVSNILSQKQQEGYSCTLDYWNKSDWEARISCFSQNYQYFSIFRNGNVEIDDCESDADGSLGCR